MTWERYTKWTQTKIKENDRRIESKELNWEQINGIGWQLARFMVVRHGERGIIGKLINASTILMKKRTRRGGGRNWSSMFVIIGLLLLLSSRLYSDLQWSQHQRSLSHTYTFVLFDTSPFDNWICFHFEPFPGGINMNEWERERERERVHGHICSCITAIGPIKQCWSIDRSTNITSATLLSDLSFHWSPIALPLHIHIDSFTHFCRFLNRLSVLCVCVCPTRQDTRTRM